jgi:hypothetical protein
LAMNAFRCEGNDVLRAKFRYETKTFRWVTLLLLSMTVLSGVIFWYALSEEETYMVLPFVGFMATIAFLFGITPWFTAHEVHDTYLVVRQGWYYRNRIDMADILAVKHVMDGPWAYGLHFIDGHTVYANGRRDHLILLELDKVRYRDGKRRRMTRVLFDTLDNQGFLKAIGKQYQVELERLDRS